MLGKIGKSVFLIKSVSFHPAFFPRTSWPKRVQIMWPQWLSRALAPTLDKSLIVDRFLCPVRALHYYLDMTSDLRQNKELVFVSFKKGFNKDIYPTTISSWIKQTVILCLRLKPMMLRPLRLLRPSSWEST